MTPKDIDDMQLSLVHAPTTFASLDPANAGRWAELLYDGKPAGVLWTDDKDGVGLVSANAARCPNVLETQSTVFNALQRLKADGTTASNAFDIVGQMPRFSLGSEQRGALSRARVLANTLSAPLTAAADAPETAAAADQYAAIMSADGDSVQELVMFTTNGAFIRSSGGWHPVPDGDDSIEQGEAIEVTDGFVPAFDSLESAGKVSRADVEKYTVAHA